MNRKLCIKLRMQSSFILFFVLSGLSIFSAGKTWADPIEEFRENQLLQFSVTQEYLFQDFVEYVFKRYCPNEYPIANEKMIQLNSDAPKDAWVVQLSARNQEFLEIFEPCAKISKILNITDKFNLRVPDYFKIYTLIRAEVILRDPERGETIEERIDAAEEFIRSDIQKEYTPKSLLKRLLQELSNSNTI